MKTKLPDSRSYPRFAGISTFCRYPLLRELLEDDPEHVVDWALYGIPFDAGVTYRPGARFGPRAIRDESHYVKPYHMEHDVNVCEVLSLADAGDAPVRPYSVKENIDSAVEFALEVGTPDHTKLLAVGGDHSVAYANILATWERRGRPRDGLALVHFDSHLDTVDTVWGEKWTHASPFIRAIEQGIVDPKRMVSIGIKGPLNTASDLDYACEHGVTIFTYEDFRRDGIEPIADRVRELGDDEAYLTFDIDCVDPAYAPGTGTPSVGGFTSAEVLALLRAMRGMNLVGADLVEVLPDRDVSGTTAFLAAHVLFEILALDAARQKG